ncbi:MAG: C10 family peptidase, partial [Melioribacteraceae bacterium]|nr:C10 family peptidase [Melioribacteraceae bacterium]
INSTEVTIKLVDNSDDQFFTISEKFEVTEPTFISLLNPNGGEVFNTGEQIVIGWKANFTPVVKIEFTSNSGGSWNEITTVNNGSTYNWTAPNLAGNNYKIKVTELNAPYPSVDESDADFEIKEGDQNADKIITYRENDSEGVPLHLGETVTISGIVTVDDQFGETGPVYIQDETAGISIYASDYHNQLSMSDEVSITGIVNQYNGLTQITEVIKIEVISTNNPVEVSEVSIGEILTQDWNGVERLEGKLVKLKEVNFQQTGEFAPNANYQVSDGSNSIPIRIDNDVQDVAGIPIPESNVDIVGVVSQFKNSKPYDSGYQIFIRGIADIKIPVNKEIELLKPNGGEKLYAGEDYLITWEAENVETISIELSTNNGQSFTTIIDEAPSGTNYKFRVPKTLLSKECLLRISDSKNSQISSISKSVFEIAPPFPENVNPMITAKWKTFTWPLNAYYPEDDNGINGHVGNACGPTAIAHILKYWEYPKRGDGYLKFTDRENHVWEANFGETIYNYQNMPDVIPGSAQESVYSETAKLMLHSMVATNDKYGSGMRINDLNESFQNYFLFSDSSEVLYREDFNETEWLIFFKEELAEGRPVFVEGWTANSTPPGQSGNHEGHYFLVDGYNDQNQFHVVWNFGDFDGYFDLYDFGDYDEYNWIIKGLKPGNIQIQPELELVSPQGGEVWISGQTAKILWNSKNINQVSIEMSTDAGNTWILLGDNISASSGEFEWEVQDLYSQSCVIRIFDSNNKSFEDRNENFFTIQNKKSFGGPYSKDENTILLMHFDNNYNYSSIASNSIAKDHGAGLSFEESHRIDLSSCLRIDNSRNDGTSVSVTHFDDLNLGENWTIEMWVKVNVFGSGTTSFPFILVKPANSGNFWESNYSIGINSNFDAFYSEYYSGNSSAGIVFGDRDQVTNNGDWYHIAFIRDVDKGKIALIMHDKEGRRISKREAAINVNLTPNFSTKDLQIGGFSTQSNAQFDGWVDELRISDTAREYGYVRLSAPNGGEILNSGSLYQISWETSGIEKINLYYSSNNGSNWNLIQANVDGSLGSYNWQTPDVSSTEYMLKIESAENVSIYDISDSPFTISVISDLEKITEAIPEEWKLFQNFPNPFNPTTQIRFSVKEEGNTKLVVYNLLGQEITILFDKFATPGNYDVSFDASGLESGMYFYRLFSGSYLETRKMLLIK